MKHCALFEWMVFGCIGMGFAQAAAPTATEDFAREHYAKYEYRIPMRDGVKLFAAVYVPQTGFKDAGPYPFLMTRTPYSCAPYGEDKMTARLGVSQELLESGLHLCVRGRARGRYAERWRVPGDELRTSMRRRGRTMWMNRATCTTRWSTC